MASRGGTGEAGFASLRMDADGIGESGAIADGERAFIGSQNLSATSLDQNRELGIIVDDPVNLARLMRTFEADFRSATPQEAP